MNRQKFERRTLADRYTRKAHVERMAGILGASVFAVGAALMVGCAWINFTSSEPLVALVQIPGFLYLCYRARGAWRTGQRMSDHFLQLRQEALDA